MYKVPKRTNKDHEPYPFFVPTYRSSILLDLSLSQQVRNDLQPGLSVDSAIYSPRMMIQHPFTMATSYMYYALCICFVSLNFFHNNFLLQLVDGRQIV